MYVNEKLYDITYKIKIGNSKRIKMPIRISYMRIITRTKSGRIDRRKSWVINPISVSTRTFKIMYKVNITKPRKKSILSIKDISK